MADHLYGQEDALVWQEVPLENGSYRGQARGRGGLGGLEPARGELLGSWGGSNLRLKSERMLTPDKQTPGGLIGEVSHLRGIHHFWREHPSKDGFVSPGSTLPGVP